MGGTSGPSAVHALSCGTFSSSTIIVMITANTPSLNASRRPFPIWSLYPLVFLCALHLTTAAAPRPSGSCFLLYEVGAGEVRRNPSSLCTTRLLPASTFKVPHALAALDAGVVSGADEKFAYDGKETSFES